MKVCYIIRPSFYELVSRYPDIVRNFDELSREQRDKLMESINIHDVMISASSYFQTSIVREDEFLYLQHSIYKHQYAIKCFGDFFLVNDEDNPFLIFLKRKFRYLFILDSE